MRFSIITPTLNRPSLERCKLSVKLQHFTDWEHIIEVDENHSGLWGNPQRVAAWEKATGDYVLYLDDDNYLAHPSALQDIHDALESERWPDWALFPIHRHGSWFMLLPPGMCMTDTANMIIKREIGRWPDIEAREADGVLAERLNANYAYSAFPKVKPIIVMEKSSNGV